MPHPKGWSKERVRRRDRLANKLQHQGYGVSRSYAIATAATRPKKRKKRKR